MTTFWQWLLKGAEDGPAGIRNILNRYVVLHITVALVAASLMKSGPFDFASKALFPAASILIGMSMAWTTRASTILQSESFRERLFTNGRSVEDYVYGFQLAILVIILMVVFVALMAGGGVNISIFGKKVDTFLSAFWLYFIISLALRECWGVVNFTNLLGVLDYSRKK